MTIVMHLRSISGIFWVRWIGRWLMLLSLLVNIQGIDQGRVEFKLMCLGFVMSIWDSCTCCAGGKAVQPTKGFYEMSSISHLPKILEFHKDTIIRWTWAMLTVMAS